MSASVELEVSRASPPAVQQGIFALAPREMVARAAEIATVLKDVVRKQHLSVNIQSKEYLTVDAWATLGTLLGVMPKERSVTEHPNGDFEAFVDLVSQSTGIVIGGGSALCSVEEARWKKAERYARRSMAITRATGKAYRLCFAWVVALAGYESTPYEEMPPEASRPLPRAQADVEGFDPENRTHAAWLRKNLETRDIDPALWDDIATTLTGRPSDAFDSVLKGFVKS